MDTHALLWGLTVLVLIIVATDQLIWRPLIAWSDKFKFEQTRSATRVTSPILTLLQHDRACCCACPRAPGTAWKSESTAGLAARKECRKCNPCDDAAGRAACGSRFRRSSPGLAAAVGSLPRRIQSAPRRHRARYSPAFARARGPPICASTPHCSSPPCGPSRSASPSAPIPSWPGISSPSPRS